MARSELIPLRLDGTLAGSSLPVVSVSNSVAAEWFANTALQGPPVLVERPIRPMLGPPLPEASRLPYSPVPIASSPSVGTGNALLQTDAH